ncbi:DUF2254 domain-containing protein [Arthrobacter zhaoguopingii]|uniref:DUF2254 domain-containing protein n=1 Tax=Arthrobacter zhaoguopingii TaxID=2681491 RepID=UPI00135C6193|nr:DUF2254 domain-containing protein [Arthrobacter zhaoguopingii]
MSGQVSRSTLRDSLRTQLWPIPLLALFVALILGQLLPLLDRAIQDRVAPLLSGLLFSGGPEAARSLMETIAGSLVTVTSLTFSLTVVTLQLASSQFSPRLLRTFTRDRFVHNTLALFLATLVFALTVLRSIRAETSTDPGFVPEISVTFAFVLAVASVIALVLFLAHLSRQIRVETMLRDVHAEANVAIARIFPEDDQPRPDSGFAGRPHGVVLVSSSSGFLTGIDEDRALSAATDTGVLISVDAAPGSSLIVGIPCARAWDPDGTAIDPAVRETVEKKLNAALRTGFERTSVQDAGFGLQQLLDVASRALSPGVNDPTTAVHAVAHISAVLCSLVSRNAGPKTLQDEDGTPRVRLTYPGFPSLLDQAMGQLLTYGMTDPRTAERTVQMLREIAWTDTSGRHLDAVLHQLSRTRAALADSGLSDYERKRLEECCGTVEAATAGVWPAGPTMDR